MKKVIACLAAVLVVGCTATRVKTPTWSMNRIDLATKKQIGGLTVSTNGTVNLEGYHSEASLEMAREILSIMSKTLGQ